MLPTANTSCLLKDFLLGHFIEQLQSSVLRAEYKMRNKKATKMNQTMNAEKTSVLFLNWIPLHTLIKKKKKELHLPPSDEAADWKRTKRDMSEKLPSWPPAQTQEAECCAGSTVHSGIPVSCVSSWFVSKTECAAWKGLDLGGAYTITLCGWLSTPYHGQLFTPPHWYPTHSSELTCAFLLTEVTGSGVMKAD